MVGAIVKRLALLVVAMMTGLALTAGAATAEIRYADEPVDALAIWPSDPSMTGVESEAFAQPGNVLLNADVSDATRSTADPPLVLPDAVVSSSCGSSQAPDPRDFDTTVWYRLAADASGQNLSETTFVMIDTIRSSLSVNGLKSGFAIAVYEDTVSPATMLACEARNIMDRNAQASFVARAGRTYFIEIAAVNGSRAGTLHTSLSYRDIAPPRLHIESPTGSFAPEPGVVAKYSLPVDDLGSGIATIAWSLAVDPSSIVGTRVGTTLKTPQQVSDELAAPEQCRRLDTPLPLLGTACTDRPAADRASYEIRWPIARKIRGYTPTLRATVTDRAGNVATVTYQPTVRDRTPPRVLEERTDVIVRGRTITVRTGCSEPGSVQAKLFSLAGVRLRKTNWVIASASRPSRKVAQPIAFPAHHPVIQNAPAGYGYVSVRCRDRGSAHISAEFKRLVQVR